MCVTTIKIAAFEKNKQQKDKKYHLNLMPIQATVIQIPKTFQNFLFYLSYN